MCTVHTHRLEGPQESELQAFVSCRPLLLKMELGSSKRGTDVISHCTPLQPLQVLFLFKCDELYQGAAHSACFICFYLPTFLIVAFEHFLFLYIQSLVLGSIALLFEGRVAMVRSYCREKGRKDSAWLPRPAFPMSPELVETHKKDAG